MWFAALSRWPAEEAASAGCWTSKLPPDTPVEVVVRWAKTRWTNSHSASGSS